MEALEELMGGGGPKDHAQINIKGKRTKRQKLQSPIPFSILTPNSSSGDIGIGDIACHSFVESVMTTDEEEEDLVANCLILLAQGGSVDLKSSNQRNRRDHGTDDGFRFTSKRFLEASGNGKVGMFVYQCKTCDRSFPSFQALGGHRASHKRPKPVEVKKNKMLLLSDEDEDEEGEIKYHISFNKPNWHPKSSPKVHECSICGDEFVSGQALGGHMRRHRTTGGTNTTEYEDGIAKKQRSVLSSSPLSQIGGDSEGQEAKKERIVLSLNLDLNLPATVDDQVEESKYSFAYKQQQQQQ